MDMEHEVPPLEPRASDERYYGRAAFLGVTGLGLSSLLWGAPVWNALKGITKPISSAAQSIGVVPDGWRIYTIASTMPRFDPRTWRLRISGLVDTPLALTYKELLALPRTETVADFHCVTGWSVSNVHWAGVRFDDLLAAAGLKPQAHALTFISAEKPYVDSLTLQQLRLPQVMLAYEMDGKPLTRAHGAPVRVVIPEMYGYKNTKWVEEIVAAPAAIAGYWEQNGYDVDAWVGRSNGYSS
jgi:DMSO/TMAO reductase YedYZ molybdopterin-dependent catalytic subunit